MRDTITAMNSVPERPDSETETIFSSRAGSPAALILPRRWKTAAMLVLVILVGTLIAGCRHGASASTLQRDDYSANLVFSNLQLSESTSLSGGKSTFVDGVVRNAGTETVTGASLEVAFANDEALPPQILPIPLTLIRTHEPYIDTQPVAQAPLTPGDQREFRLIFEGVGTNWNQALPQIRVLHVYVHCTKACG